MDTRTPEQRSRIMRSVGSRHTAPEMIVRKLIHGLGFRFRLHQKRLPGSPDLVLARHGAVIFVNGCFWHGHDCSKGRLPKTRLDFWVPKIRRNQARDTDATKALEADGWRVLTIWQCETKDSQLLRRRLKKFFGRKQRGRL
ncbi:DNA mismatch endonuclease Vsr [Bradyrhizobium sp. AUGA SZCCT0176]|uniref:very short patch repair endonuclease n=1 Tax=Bradyrhizobium sp. AUGA SZCCT0176 TaxID=2807664 RepID=UPI001BA84B53|nr:DNA mismatch endonuclease Vsr [Bradyrhizobium sp. AUGA SZCCT0176]MBR1226894.1 DNA mismatch endonuclease Vsr [Bradyrhizobium sp. AUGA SZCCT0176]